MSNIEYVESFLETLPDANGFFMGIPFKDFSREYLLKIMGYMVDERSREINQLKHEQEIMNELNQSRKC